MRNIVFGDSSHRYYAHCTLCKCHTIHEYGNVTKEKGTCQSCGFTIEPRSNYQFFECDGCQHTVWANGENTLILCGGTQCLNRKAVS